MSKAVLVRGAFALQCRLSVPPVTVAVSRCSHCSTHYRTPTVKYGTVQKSNLAKWRQDDVCCRRAIRRWNAETVTFPAMCGTPAAEQKISIHSAVSGKSSVCVGSDCNNVTQKELRTKIGLLAYFTVYIRYTICTVLGIPFP